MRKKEKALIVQKVFNTYFPSPDIPLAHKDPYTLLIAILLSAQCTDIRVNQVTPLLFKKGGSPQKMIKLIVEEIEEIVRPCGLAPTKAHAIWGLSKKIIEAHGGQVPNTSEALEALPGVGHKTASVVMAQAFGIPAFPVDTHIHRCAKRWGLSQGKTVEQTEKDLKKIFDEEDWNLLHLQMILFARKFCPAKKHDPYLLADMKTRNHHRNPHRNHHRRSQYRQLRGRLKALFRIFHKLSQN